TETTDGAGDRPTGRQDYGTPGWPKHRPRFRFGGRPPSNRRGRSPRRTGPWAAEAVIRGAGDPRRRPGEQGTMTHAQKYLEQAARISLAIDHEAVERMAAGLAALRDRGGRLFLIGVGGSAANCSHAVNDFRKLAGIEAYSPCDNVAELTARTN